jgi:hypothetical protein
VVTKLLRNSEYCAYAATAGKVFDNLDDCERKFNQVRLLAVGRGVLVASAVLTVLCTSPGIGLKSSRTSSSIRR